MIYCINARNVNQALSQGLRWLGVRGEPSESRVGTVLVSPCPVVTTYSRPEERVLFSPERDANPFFHLMECIWMMAGRNDVAFLTHFNKRYTEYSDDGDTAWGAYGWRWRSFFGYDQLPVIIDELRANPQSRRCVLTMWNGESGAGAKPDLLVATNGGKDVPCNTHIYFRVRTDKARGPVLDMMVNNRSNDVIWGAYGANAVHFSFLQEVIAFAVGVGVGQYHQNSFNYHAYTDVYPREKFVDMAGDAYDWDLYTAGTTKPTPLLLPTETYENFVRECEQFCDGDAGFTIKFLSDTAEPMRRAWSYHKEKNYVEAGIEASRIAAPDWRRACVMWLERRAHKWEMKRG